MQQAHVSLHKGMPLIELGVWAEFQWHALMQVTSACCANEGLCASGSVEKESVTHHSRISLRSTSNSVVATSLLVFSARSTAFIRARLLYMYTTTTQCKLLYAQVVLGT